MAFRPDGSLKMRVPYEKDKREGKATLFNAQNEPHGYRWYKQDRLLASESFNRMDEQGRKSGPWKVFHPSGRVIETGFYVEGLKHGTFQYFDARGSVTAVVEYRFGEEVLPESVEEPVVEVQTTHRPDGSIAETVTYVNGIKEGVARQYDEGRGGGGWIGVCIGRVGRRRHHHERGEKKRSLEGVLAQRHVACRGTICERCIERRRWVFYRESGEKEQQGEYIADAIHGAWTWWYPGGPFTGKKRTAGGEPVGTFVEYDTTGAALVSGAYEQGLRHGAWRIQVNDHLEEGNYVYGEKDGVWTHTYGNGKRQFEGAYVVGQPDGKHRTWHENGVLEEEGKYESGAKHKKWRLYDDTGVVLHEYIYRYGKLRKVDGSKVDKRRDGKLKGN